MWKTKPENYPVLGFHPFWASTSYFLSVDALFNKAIWLVRFQWGWMCVVLFLLYDSVKKRNIKPYADFNQRTLDFFFFCVTWRKKWENHPWRTSCAYSRGGRQEGWLRKVDKLAHLVFLAQSLWFLVPFQTTPFFKDHAHKLQNSSSNLQRRADMSVFPATKVTKAEGHNCKADGC